MRTAPPHSARPPGFRPGAGYGPHRQRPWRIVAPLAAGSASPYPGRGAPRRRSRASGLLVAGFSAVVPPPPLSPGRSRQESYLATTAPFRSPLASGCSHTWLYFGDEAPTVLHHPHAGPGGFGRRPLGGHLAVRRFLTGHVHKHSAVSAGPLGVGSPAFPNPER